MQKIAFPSNNDQGLAGKLSMHFGHSKTYTIVTLDEDAAAISAVVAPRIRSTDPLGAPSRMAAMSSASESSMRSDNTQPPI